MIHARRQIREAVATALTGLATTGTKVHQSRMRPQGDSALPCLLVETGPEQIVLDGINEVQARTLDIIVRGYAKATANVDDTLDAIALEVETAMHTAGNLSGLIKNEAYLEEIQVDFDELEKPVGVVMLRFKAIYFTQAGAPGTTL